MLNLQDHSNDLLLFAQIVRSGSLSSAAIQLGLGRSAVSKRLMSLEKKVGSRLLQRTTRKMSLTEVGEEVLLEAHKIEIALSAIASISENHQKQYAGHIKVSCTGTLRRFIVPLLKPFTEKHPNIAINLQLEDRFVDIVKEQVDVAVRVGELSDSSLIAQKLGQFDLVVCASPAYLEEHGTPKVPVDLKKHSCIYYQNSSFTADTWSFQGSEGVDHVAISGALSMNDSDGLIAAAMDGLGVLMLDHVVSRDAIASGKLVRLLPNHRMLGSLPVYLVYPAREYMPARVHAFIDHLMAELKPLF